MAKPRPITIAPGLTLADGNFAFGDHGADLDLVVARAHSAAVKVKDDATAAEVNAACKMHAVAWGALLALDPEVAAITPETPPLTVGPILVAAAQRAALPCADPCALVLAVAEVARLHALATIPRNRDRLRALLAEPCTVEAAVWEVDLLRYTGHVPIGQPTTAAHRDAMMQAHADACAKVDAHNAERERILGAAAAGASTGLVPPRILPAPAAPVFLPAVRLRGGLCGRSGVTLRPAGESSLAWAAAAWRVSCAALEGPRKVAEPKASAAKIGELPVVISVDGEVVIAANLLPADIATARRGSRSATSATSSPTITAAAHADAFVAEATRKRDEAFKIEGEASDLAMVADPSWTLYDVPEAQQAAVRGLAAALITGDARAPDFERVRDHARYCLVQKRRSKRWGSNSDRVQLWADALLAEVTRVQRIAEDLKREEEARRRAEKQERSHARKRAA